MKLHIFVDWPSVEVFGYAGQVSITDQIFPMPSPEGVVLEEQMMLANETSWRFTESRLTGSEWVSSRFKVAVK
jgi:sucrose-6-phosphate hydrolase SacC (GH32 family)